MRNRECGHLSLHCTWQGMPLTRHPPGPNSVAMASWTNSCRDLGLTGSPRSVLTRYGGVWPYIVGAVNASSDMTLPCPAQAPPYPCPGRMLPPPPCGYPRPPGSRPPPAPGPDPGRCCPSPYRPAPCLVLGDGDRRPADLRAGDWGLSTPTSPPILSLVRRSHESEPSTRDETTGTGGRGTKE